jgi:hypothetical protein
MDSVNFSCGSSRSPLIVIEQRVMGGEDIQLRLQICVIEPRAAVENHDRITLVDRLALSDASGN